MSAPADAFEAGIQIAATLERHGVPYALAIRDDLLDRLEHDGWLSPAAGHRYVDEMLRPGPFVPPTQRLASFLGHPVSSAPLAARMRRAIEAANQAAGGLR